MKKISIIILLLVLMNACTNVYSNEIDKVKNIMFMYLPSDITFGDAVERYKYFTSKRWKAYKIDDSNTVVIFEASLLKSGMNNAVYVKLMKKTFLVFKFIIVNNEVVNYDIIIKATDFNSRNYEYIIEEVDKFPTLKSIYYNKKIK